jgi:hypothetical protein
MRLLLAGLLLLLVASDKSAAHEPDCVTEQSAGPSLPLSLDLAGRPGVPAGTTGQAYIAIPMYPPGIACRDARPPPADILHGEPGDTLGPPVGNLLRGSGTPYVTVETR